METEAGKFSSSLSSVEAILLVLVVSRLFQHCDETEIYHLCMLEH